MIDAAPMSSIDAGPFCTDSSQCTVAGECCFFLAQPPGFCVPGEEQLGVCLPD